jgi:ubiquitin C-terminal hydrolase
MHAGDGMQEDAHGDMDQAQGDDEAGLEPVWYRLYGVVEHHGKLDSGHYTCFIR